jgi:hypothetical protein
MRANSLIVTVHQAAASVQHRFVQFAGMSSRPAYRMLRLGQIIQSGNYVGAQRARSTDTAIVCLNGSRRYYIFLLAMRRRGHMLIAPRDDARLHLEDTGELPIAHWLLWRGLVALHVTNSTEGQAGLPLG